LAGTDADEAACLEVDFLEVNDVDALSGMDKLQGVEEDPIGGSRRVETTYKLGSVDHLDGEVGVDAALKLKRLNRRLSTCDH
jgi:hypothetical protein